MHGLDAHRAGAVKHQHDIERSPSGGGRCWRGQLEHEVHDTVDVDRNERAIELD